MKTNHCQILDVMFSPWNLNFPKEHGNGQSTKLNLLEKYGKGLSTELNPCEKQNEYV